MQVTDIQGKRVDRLFRDYIEAPIDPEDRLQTEKEDHFIEAVTLLSVGGVSPEVIEDKIGVLAYSIARAAFHAGYNEAQKH